MKIMNSLRIAWPALLVATICAAPAQAQARQEKDLTQLDLATLMQMDVEVTTASKSAQSIYSVAAPIFVITADDIRRSGASSIPDALRLAPGVAVGQIDPRKWAVSIRGFAWQYANKALILLDGRAVYSPLNSSVYWNTLDVPMEDINRIEVIRGPGDARWGSHAVNGIINIITKSAAEVRGASVSARLDADSSTVLTLRHGGALSDHADYRAYAKYLSAGDFPSASGTADLGDSHALRAGLRIDGESRSGKDRFTFIGDVQSGRDVSSIPATGFVPFHYDVREWDALMRWERGTPGQLNQQAQLSLDHIGQEIYEDRDTLDFAYQVQLTESGGQLWTFGMGYKRSSDALPAAFSIVPDQITQTVYSAFIHDRIDFGGNSQLLLGSQFEHNPYSGWEVQPNAQLLYTPSERRSFWASVSRAVRSPLRTEDGFNLDVPIFPGGVLRLVGNRDLHAESVVAWQAGMRLALRTDLFVDLAAFYNRYQDLIIQQEDPPFFEPSPAPGRTIFPAVYYNSASGQTKGIEAVLKTRPVARWGLAMSYSLYSQTALSDPLGYGAVTGIDHQFQIHSNADIAPNLQWNLDLYYIGALSTGELPGYYKLDSQLAWTPRKNVQLAIGVRNALDHERRQVGANSVDTVTRIPRRGYLQLMWQF